MLAAGFTKNKSANLGEAYEFFTGKKLENAHSALADVDACITVFFAIRDGQRERAAA
jgi:DNA polymerase-3 subunit epsilon